MLSLLDDTVTSISAEFFYEAISQMAKLPEVKKEVERNHDDNRWWPNSVTDWRLRMVFAGWSTRVSYAMIEHYIRVVKAAVDIGYDALIRLPPADLREVIAPIGLPNARQEFLHSLKTTLETLANDGVDPCSVDAEWLIKYFAKAVDGASYKVAQCAVLYARGYHCGVMPVDSGMCEMLGPAMPFGVPRYPEDHEAIRKHLETLVKRDSERYLALIRSLSYDVAIPEHAPPTWCVHLILIYYKRLFWNRHTSVLFPREKTVEEPLKREVPQSEIEVIKKRFPLIVVEGPDGAGKSSIVRDLKRMGYNDHHAAHNPDHTDIVKHYETLISDSQTPVVFDRSYFSEVVYGTLFRGGSRISETAAARLCATLRKQGAVVLYLHEDLATLFERNNARQVEEAHGSAQLRKLMSAYELAMRKFAQQVPVYWLRPSRICTMTFWRALARAN